VECTGGNESDDRSGMMLHIDALRAADAGRADLLFAHAVGCIERSRGVDLNGLHTLGAFLVSATDAGAKGSVNKGVVVRFLNCALMQLTRRGSSLKASNKTRASRCLASTQTDTNRMKLRPSMTFSD